jgi:hypothetical protein
MENKAVMCTHHAEGLVDPKVLLDTPEHVESERGPWLIVANLSHIL